MENTDLSVSDYDYLEDSIRQRLMIEILHNIGLIPDSVYFAKYPDNSETLDRDYKIWQELEDIK